MNKYFYFLFLIPFLLYGCGQGSKSLVDKLSTVNRDLVNVNWSSSTVTGISVYIDSSSLKAIDFPDMKGLITVSSITVNSSIVVKGLENYNKPVIAIDSIEIMKKFSSNSKYMKVVRKFDGDKKVSETIEVNEPIKTTNNHDWIYILAQVIILTLIYLLYRKMKVDK